jgi:hypothetical protein
MYFSPLPSYLVVYLILYFNIFNVFHIFNIN